MVQSRFEFLVFGLDKRRTVSTIRGCSQKWVHHADETNSEDQRLGEAVEVCPDRAGVDGFSRAMEVVSP